MNFEAKHIVRWGIPGWFYSLVIFMYFLMDDKESLVRYLNELDVSIVGITALLAVIGVIIGHMIHQISMLFGFLIFTNWKKYFRAEYELDQMIMKSNFGSEIQRIYRHRLGQVHALRALATSGILSLFTIVLLLWFYSYSIKTICLLIIVLFLTIILLINHKYFKKNLDYFIKQIKMEKYSI
ncbi:hypothetical protein ACQKCU_15265 [Heyndrickxia sporothermodurans]